MADQKLGLAAWYAQRAQDAANGYTKALALREAAAALTTDIDMEPAARAQYAVWLERRADQLERGAAGHL